MKRIIELKAKEKEIREEIEYLTKDLKKQLKEIDESLNEPEIDNVQFTFYDHIEPQQYCVSDTTLSDDRSIPFEDRFKTLFDVIDYEICNTTDHFQTLENKDEILDLTHKWLDKHKSLDENHFNNNDSDESSLNYQDLLKSMHRVTSSSLKESNITKNNHDFKQVHLKSEE